MPMPPSTSNVRAGGCAHPSLHPHLLSPAGPLLSLSFSRLQLNGAGQVQSWSGLSEFLLQRKGNFLIFPNVFFSFKSGPIYLLDAFANGKSNEAMWPSVRLGLPGTRQALGPWGPRLQPCPQLHRASLCRLLAPEPLGSIISCLSPFPSALPPLLCSVHHSATVASATGIETGPVVLKHPASEAEIQPQTQVTLRCHIDGHPR